MMVSDLINIKNRNRLIICMFSRQQTQEIMMTLHIPERRLCSNHKK
jgi:hypothetical protein